MRRNPLVQTPSDTTRPIRVCPYKLLITQDLVVSVELERELVAAMGAKTAGLGALFRL
jgi:hypothetical protein